MAITQPLKICVVQLGRYGDMVLSTPLLVAVRRTFPDARITLIASEAAASIAAHQSCVDDIIEVSRGAMGLGGGLLRLRMHAFDLYIDAKDHRSSSSRLLALGARTQRGITHDSNAARRFESLPPTAPPFHYVDRMLAPMQLLAPNVTFERRPSLDVPPEYAVAATTVRAALGDVYAVLNISASALSRRLSFDQSHAVVQWLAAKIPLVIVSSPADRETAHALATIASRSIALPSKSSESQSIAARSIAADTNHILEMAAIVAGAALLVTPDTAAVHVASAFDIPTVALFPSAADNLRLFAPLAARQSVVTAAAQTAIGDIDVEEILKAISHVMSIA